MWRPNLVIELAKPETQILWLVRRMTALDELHRDAARRPGEVNTQVTLGFWMHAPLVR